MPVQTQMSSFAKKMGVRVAQANAEHKDKPIDTGNQRLPPGIRNGIAKLTAMYTKEYADDTNGPGTRGQTFFRASAIVMSPESINGHKVAGIVTQVIIPLCDMPAKGKRKAVSFSDNWFEFQNLFKLLGIAPPEETAQTDPSGQRTEAYYFAAMKALTDPTRAPVYINFSTRGWTPPVTSEQPKPAEMVFETWHGLVEYNGQADPGAGVTEFSPTSDGQKPFTEPPTGQVNHPISREPSTELSDDVEVLVEIAVNDPEGATDEGMRASARLEEMAWAKGWSKEQTAAATDWADVGAMVLGAPTSDPSQSSATSSPLPPIAPAIGSKWRFAKRTRDGAKLKNNKGEEFPPQDVEVTAVDHTTKICNVKTTRDGKDVIDIRSKKPVAVKWEWLEA